MRINEVLTTPDYMYHATLTKNVPKILANGLKINSEPVLTTGGFWAKHIYGCQPIYLSTFGNHASNKTRLQLSLLEVDVAGVKLVADLPSIIDHDALISDEGYFYWEDSEVEWNFSELLDPSSKQCYFAKLLTETAASLHDIPASRIKLVGKI